MVCRAVLFAVRYAVWPKHQALPLQVYNRYISEHPTDRTAWRKHIGLFTKQKVQNDGASNVFHCAPALEPPCTLIRSAKQSNRTAKQHVMRLVVLKGGDTAF